MRHTKHNTVMASTGKTRQTDAAFRHSIFDPSKYIANTPKRYEMLLNIRKIPRTDGWLI